MQISSQTVTTNKPTPGFLQAGCPSCRPTNNVGALKGKSNAYRGFAHPKFIWDLPSLSLTTKGSWLPWGRVAKHLISPLMLVSHNTEIENDLP